MRSLVLSFLFQGVLLLLIFSAWLKARDVRQQMLNRDFPVESERNGKFVESTLLFLWIVQLIGDGLLLSVHHLVLLAKRVVRAPFELFVQSINFGV